MEHRTLTIVFADMKGFTSRTSRQSRSATVELVRRLQELLLPILEDYGGRLLKTIGDGFLLTFESPTNAVLTSITLQEALREHNAGVGSSARIEVRIAVNTGEVTLSDGDVYGEAVNIAARVQEVAKPNEVYLTESTYLSMNKAEALAVPVGRRAFKGIPQPVALYRVVQGGPFQRWWAQASGGRFVTWASVAAVGLLLWAVIANLPHTTPPASEAPSVPSEEPPAADTVAEPASEEIVLAIAQLLQSHEERIAGFVQELADVEQRLQGYRRELAQRQNEFSRLDGQFYELVRSLPQVRANHRQQVNALIERYTRQEDLDTAALIQQELSQYEADVAEWETQFTNRVSAIKASLQAVQQWDRWLEEWRPWVEALKQELAGRSAEIEQLKALTAWDQALDAMTANLEAFGQQLTQLKDGAEGVLADLELRQQEIADHEQYVQSWQDFRDQWRAYLYSR